MHLGRYENVISLGYFCGVAIELEKMGLRNQSYPFDWLITANFEKVLEFIENGFVGFLEYDNLYQEASVYHQYYFDAVNNIHFYHDFSQYASLKEQFAEVKAKYARRIARFYETIKKPTVFVRYCNSLDEVNFILRNFDRIENTIKSFNENNVILYFCSHKLTVANNKTNIYYVKSKDDVISQCSDLKKALLSSVVCENKKNNLRKYKKARRARLWRKVKRIVDQKLAKFLKIKSKRIYNHDKQV